jgi:hypothetical protein
MNGADAWAVADPTLCPVCGSESCEDHVPAERQQGSGQGKLRVVRALDLLSAPAPIEVVEGIAWAGCLTVLVSESGTGKTFLLLDLAAALSDGLSWHGRTTRPGSVVYISYEGDALSVRLRAIHDRGHRLEHLYVIPGHDPISPRVTRDGEERSIGELALTVGMTALVTELEAKKRPPLVVVMIDTVRASMTGSEDSSEHVSAYLRAVRRIQACVPDAAVILAHHAGWQDGDTQRKRERGSSAWRGNCDCTLFLEAGEYDSERGEAELTLRALKTRDAEKPAPLHLVRRRVEILERTRRGDPVTSCVIEHDRRSKEVRDAEDAKALAAAHLETDLKVLRAIRDRPDLATSQDVIRQVVSMRKAIVGESLARLVLNGCVAPKRGSQPYRMTEEGRLTLEAYP